jgi:hypothetical protein
MLFDSHDGRQNNPPLSYHASCLLEHRAHASAFLVMVGRDEMR